MLVLTRKKRPGQDSIVISHPAGDILIKICNIDRDRVSVGIMAHDDVHVRRLELLSDAEQARLAERDR